MNRTRSGPLLLLLLLMVVPVAVAQSAPAGTVPADGRAEVLRHFEISAGKLIALAEAIPADRYGWRPADGVMSVAEVFTHLAHYNYEYLDLIGVPVPAGVNLEAQGRLTARADVVPALRRSVEHVQAATRGMTAADVAQPARLYGRDVTRWAVLLQLVAHMNEHLGQQIAYARLNGVTPPWSQ